ncbi:MAG: hydroxymethylglutaryl-CoA lyase [Planctomycetota bacterium]
MAEFGAPSPPPSPSPEVRIVEVGPRDGLQNEPAPIPTEVKVRFVRGLAAAGLREIEVTSFVHPKAVPQLADAAEVLEALDAPAARAAEAAGGPCYSALVPNPRGLERAIASGIGRIAVFTAASDAFTQANIRMSVAESLEVFGPVVAEARAAGLDVRGYVSTAFTCPYAGEVSEDRVREVVAALAAMGCREIAVSDTIGAAAPRDIRRVLGAVADAVPMDRIALHLHDTYGTALANVQAGWEAGVRCFDASAGGLGGCPYAPGAAGNLATEDLVYFLERQGIATGIDLEAVFRAASLVSEVLGRPLPGKNWQRLAAACRSA